MEVFLNRMVEFCLNNTINLRHLTPHIMPYYAYKMATGSWYRFCDFTLRIRTGASPRCATSHSCHHTSASYPARPALALGVRVYIFGGVFIVSSQSFKCSLVYAKRSFYAAVNGLFGKLLILASELVGVGVEFNAPLDTI